MKPHQSSVSAEGKDLDKSRSPAMRNACDACICSVFRYLEGQLTVFLGARIAGSFYRQEYRKKVSLGGERSELWRSNNSVSSRTCACGR
jgi:hypothetical protein